MRVLSSSGPLDRRLGCTVAVAALLLGACANEGRPGSTGAAGAAAGGSGGSSGVAGRGTAGSNASGGAGSSGGAGATGGAGAPGTAGAIGSAGATGTAGVSGAAGAGGQRDGGIANGDAGHVMASTGCGKPAGQTLMTYVKYTEMIAGVPAAWMPRNYYVWLPAGYNPERAYPTVFVGPGCDAIGNAGIPIFNASGADAIVIGLDPDPQAEHRQCFNSESYPDPEVPYFDATLAKIEDTYCVDKSRVFIGGFSSGSWLANLIGCVDSGVVRGQGNASGCMQGVPAGTCKGPIAYFGAHNNPDPNNSYGCGTSNRDRIVALNGCSTQTTPYDPGPGVKAPAGATISCVQYVGCKPGYPVVFCTTTGRGHNDQVGTGLSTFGFWNFWMSLP